MAFVLKVDNREQQLKQLFIDSANDLSGFSVECSNLVCGDFILEVDEKPLIIIERKTVADLVASIRDGRLRVQKARMCEMHDFSKVLYIIEGNITLDKASPHTINGLEKTSIVSSILNTIFRDNIKVIQTMDVHGTYGLIEQILMRVAKDPTKFSGQEGHGQGVMKEDFIHKHKVSNKEDMFFYQLTQVPGISAKTADAFVKLYGSMLTFYETMMPLDDGEKLKLLKNITIQDNNAKPRRISTKVAEAIVKFMF